MHPQLFVQQEQGRYQPLSSRRRLQIYLRDFSEILKNDKQFLTSYVRARTIFVNQCLHRILNKADCLPICGRYCDTYRVICLTVPTKN